jgi:hypothetical protein
LEAYEIDPTCDARWGAFVERHPRASVFHGAAWLRALRRTYGYVPVAFTTSAPGEALRSAIVFCHVNSWLTGHRLVSLPFSDHCEPLCDSSEELGFLIRHLQSTMNQEHWKYLEIRPVSERFSEARGGFAPAAKFLLHTLDIRPDLAVLFHSFDKDSVQRRIRRADRAALVEECGNSDELLSDFYRLFVITRRRHRLPPIPRIWFRNLIQEQNGAVEIRVAYTNGKPIAAILTLRFGSVVYYKYGCSNHTFNRLGAIPWLFWKAIKAAKSSGALQFDMGRTEVTHAGLLVFKNHWVSNPQELTYWDFPVGSPVGPANGWKMKTASHIFSLMPKSMLEITGRLLYRHIG